MSYYQGDFYQGDPGFFSGLTKVIGGAASFIPGVGGFLGKAISGLSNIAKKPAVQKLSTAIMKHPTLSAAGGAATIGATMGTAARLRAARAPAVMPGAGLAPGLMRAPRGAHLAGGRKHRRMRVTNVKALRRAIRRARGFEKMARKVMHFVSPRAHKGRAVFRVRRRAK